MQSFKFISLGLFLFCLNSLSSAEDRIPFYEDYLKESDLNGFLETSRKFLETNPNAIEAPRLAMDYLMAAKAAQDLNAIDRATSLLLFTYPKSLPSLNFIGSFERGSPRLIDLLKEKALSGNLSDPKFAFAFCRSILFIVRSQGPDLLKDPSLRLQTYLLAQKAEVEEIQTTTLQSLEELRKGNNALSKVARVVLDSGELFDKLKSLSTLSGPDARFCIKYYLAQLSEKEARTPEVLTLSVINALFSHSPRSEEAFNLIDSLPEKVRNEPKIQTFLGYSQHLDERTKEAIVTLQGITDGNQNEWKETAASYANGLEFAENRKTNLLGSLGKAMDHFDQGGEALQLEVEWSGDSGTEGPVAFRVLLRISKPQESLEIQMYRNQEIHLAYRTTPKDAFLLLPSALEKISFQGPGALPIPTMQINRDTSSGVFDYAFNLNFASSTSFGKLLEEAEKLVDNAYLGTPRGREVLLEYLLTRKPIWLVAGQTINSGISYPVRSLNPDNPQPAEIEISFDLSGDLSSVKFGEFVVKNIELDSESSLKPMPEWPDVKNTPIEKFDFQLFMKVLNEATKLGGG